MVEPESTEKLDFIARLRMIHLRELRSRFATDQEPVKSRRESERRPTQEMTGPSCQQGNFNGPGQEEEAEADLPIPPVQTIKSGSLPQELKVDRQVPSAHSAKKAKRFLEENASFHRPAPVMSEDEED
ncbi:hypothetical protein CAPTEDRAFT_204349 [Capitella teleta]|uniref:Uncharacterized protein n=1 Tax=Capitella teleta TaxID=283909 RepID=R7V187_CAPTE|nr:hypothetical protein CAPTEDRAFT_204349 [Capitella teleta]|eukprot:ELU12304.1 hypothetical protein CAPTEDRAFT_204349 [Capitella teleta]